MEWTQADYGKWRRGWLLEVYDLSGRLVQKVPMAEAEEGFLINLSGIFRSLAIMFS